MEKLPLRIIIGAIFIFLAISYFGSRGWLTVAKEKLIARQLPSPTPIASPDEAEPEPLNISGEIRAEKSVNLKFQTSGKLAWVDVKEGDYVKKWQAIASLDKKELEKKFQKEMNDYLNERWDFEQTQNDYQTIKENRLVTDEIKRILEKAQFDLNNIVLDAEIADLAVKYATIFSPIDGIVTKIDEPIAGVNITPATAVFTIIDPKSVYFEAKADEEEVTKLQVGTKGIILLDAYPDQKLDSRITFISFSPMSGETSTTYAVRLSLPENTNLRFRLGMGGEVEIKI